MTAIEYLARERLDYFTYMLRATGWTEDDGYWLAPERLRERLAQEVGRGHVALWIALAAQVQADTSLIRALTEVDDGCPKGDPECLGNNGDCHDACESPSPLDLSNRKIRYAPIDGVTLDAARQRIPKSLSRMGDCRLVWVNEGDLCIIGEEMH